MEGSQVPKITFNYQGQLQSQSTVASQKVTNIAQSQMQSGPQYQLLSPNQLPQQQYSSQLLNPKYGQKTNIIKHVQDITLLKPLEKENTIAAIIVSFVAGASYDELFSTIEQKTVEGTQVLVYACSANSVGDISKALRGHQCSEIAQELGDHIKKVHADCVVFNWECSSNYTSSQFPEGKDEVMIFLKMVLDRGHMAMFSDFSLKALIRQWNTSLLGANPFVQTGETSAQVELRFKSGVLKECPSAQLQIVGEMADQGKVNLHVLGGTILYSVDPAKIDKNAYQLSVLTINTTNLPPPQLTLTIDEHKGSAGHVLLKYKSGGQLLTSMGHWIELMKIDTSEHKLFEVAEKQYGKEYASKMRMQYSSMNKESQKAYVQTQARNFVQSQAPCSNMNFKG